MHEVSDGARTRDNRVHKMDPQMECELNGLTLRQGSGPDSMIERVFLARGRVQFPVDLEQPRGPEVPALRVVESRHDGHVLKQRASVVVAIAATAATAASSCSGSARTVPVPPPTASAAVVAQTLLAAYQAGDVTTLHKLTAATLHLRPGDLGHISHVRWRSPIRANQTYPGFAPGRYTSRSTPLPREARTRRSRRTSTGPGGSCWRDTHRPVGGSRSTTASAERRPRPSVSSTLNAARGGRTLRAVSGAKGVRGCRRQPPRVLRP